MDSDTAAISAAGLVRTFGEVNAVNGVDLSVGSGEMYGFLGPNGAGKSTMVRMLTTLLRPTAGTARVAGFDVAEETEAVRLRIGSKRSAREGCYSARCWHLRRCHFGCC